MLCQRKLPEMNRNTRCDCKVQKLDDQYREFMKKFITQYKYKMSSCKCPKSYGYANMISFHQKISLQFYLDIPCCISLNF